jgi:hypothetical protein
MEHLRRFVLWFTNGVALTCGVLAVVWVASLFEKQEAPAVAPYQPRPNSAVQISSIKVIPLSDVLSVSGSMLSSESSRLSVTLEFSVLEDGQVSYTCPRRVVTYNTPGDPMRFQLECGNLRRDKIPEKATLLVQVIGVSVVPQ